MSTLLESIDITSKYIGKSEQGHITLDKWEVCLYRGDVKTTVDFYLGEGHKGREPELKEVIHSLISGNYIALRLTFEEFCCDYGYDTDSRKAFATWEDCERIAIKLRELFTADEIMQLEIGFENY
jgi:hypothetical protein